MIGGGSGGRAGGGGVEAISVPPLPPQPASANVAASKAERMIQVRILTSSLLALRKSPP
jgi:hypothetical protein